MLQDVHSMKIIIFFLTMLFNFLIAHYYQMVCDEIDKQSDRYGELQSCIRKLCDSGRCVTSYHQPSLPILTGRRMIGQTGLSLYEDCLYTPMNLVNQQMRKMPVPLLPVGLPRA